MSESVERTKGLNQTEKGKSRNEKAESRVKFDFMSESKSNSMPEVSFFGAASNTSCKGKEEKKVPSSLVTLNINRTRHHEQPKIIIVSPQLQYINHHDNLSNFGNSYPNNWEAKTNSTQNIRSKDFKTHSYLRFPSLPYPLILSPLYFNMSCFFGLPFVFQK